MRALALQMCEGSMFQAESGPKLNSSCVPGKLGARKTGEEQRGAEQEEPESKRKGMGSWKLCWPL